jgi:superfamily II DNA or RNA helicase
VGLRDRQWQRFLRGPDQDLVEELYEPALSVARRYDRSCAYFSSTVLAAAARGFGPFIEHLLELGAEAPKPAVRLVVNEELSREDVTAILEGRDTERLAARLLARLSQPSDELERDRLAMLALMVQRGLLEVRVGLMRHGSGIVHAKFGVVVDESGDAVVFMGSGNETGAGLLDNYEKLDVSTSWDDPARFAHYRDEFAQLWEDRDPAVTTLPLPDAVRLNLVRFAVEDEAALLRRQRTRFDRRRLETAMRWRFVTEAPFFPAGEQSCDATAPVDLWAHQVRVVSETAEAWPAGRLLCDEVGMGKTVEAIMALRRLLAGRGVKRVLLLVSAGLLKQWQEELREKGGLIVPRLEGQQTLVWPDGTSETAGGLGEALEQPNLLISRELVRLEQNAAVLLQAPKWDLVLLDEAHAARRAKQEEREFNSATLLLGLLRRLQLEGRVRGILLLSATPMQTHPWEPWDLLSVLGEGSPWLSDFAVVREFYDGIAKVGQAGLAPPVCRRLAQVVEADEDFPPSPVPGAQLSAALLGAAHAQRQQLIHWLRHGAPLGRRMHRNTRATLRRYYDLGLLHSRPPTRAIQDTRFHYLEQRERDVYDAITRYVNRRFEELEAERPGKGFVMTVYRRRASSSPFALDQSLRRRADGLNRVITLRATGDDLDREIEDRSDFDEFLLGETHVQLSSALPEDPQVAKQELRDVERILEQLKGLQGTDSKFAQFQDALRVAADDGRPVLVFSEFADTVTYLRDLLYPAFGASLACYTGEGGQVWRGGRWTGVPKDDVTAKLGNGELRVLLCTDAASEGLNLQAAGALINYDLPWNPSRVEQRIGRIDRIGQRADSVRIVNLVLADSVDERVYEVLRRRCGLFKHFVGPMQPVLAQARGMLLGVRPFDEQVLVEVEAGVKADAVALEAFVETEDVPRPQGPPGLGREDMARAFRDAFPTGAAVLAGRERRLGLFQEQLEEDVHLWPVSPLSPELRRRADDLIRAGELLPLVVQTHEEGAFRVSVAIWVGAEQREIVERVDRLEALLGVWDGRYVPPREWMAAETEAKRLARERVAEMRRAAGDRERRGLERQVAAARLRLVRELGRYLLCVAPDAADLNEVFFGQLTRDIASAVRLRRVHDRISYPDWESAFIADVREQVRRLTAGQRSSVLLGKPLDAALDDPRWVAAETLKRLDEQTPRTVDHEPMRPLSELRNSPFKLPGALSMPAKPASSGAPATPELTPPAPKRGKESP